MVQKPCRTRKEHKIQENFPEFNKLSQKQRNALKAKINDFPGPLKVEIAWQLIKEVFDELNSVKGFD